MFLKNQNTFSVKLAFIITAALSSFAMTAQAQDIPSPPSFKAKSFVLVDYQTGQILAGENEHERVEPASITKVMTSYVAYDEIKNGRLKYEDEVTVSESAWRRGLDSSESRMFIEVGKPISVEALINGIVIQSGNDASVALSQHVAGSQDAFAGMMNKHAKRIGMTGSQYKNATGLPAEGHYTTAYDIALLSSALIHDFPEGYELYKKKEYTFNNIRQFNRNRLLWRDPTVDGIKTGHTEAAGYCLAASAIRDGRRLIAVVMGTDGEEARAQASMSLLNYGFRFFETATLYTANSKIQSLPLYKGSSEEVEIAVASDLAVSIPRGSRSRLNVQAEVKQPLIAPLRRGQVVGTVKVTLNDKQLTSQPLVVLQDVTEGSIFRRVIDTVRLKFND